MVLAFNFTFVKLFYDFILFLILFGLISLVLLYLFYRKKLFYSFLVALLPGGEQVELAKIKKFSQLFLVVNLFFTFLVGCTYALADLSGPSDDQNLIGLSQGLKLRYDLLKKLVMTTDPEQLAIIEKIKEKLLLKDELCAAYLEKVDLISLSTNYEINPSWGEVAFYFFLFLILVLVCRIASRTSFVLILPALNLDQQVSLVWGKILTFALVLIFGRFLYYKYLSAVKDYLLNLSDIKQALTMVNRLVVTALSIELIFWGTVIFNIYFSSNPAKSIQILVSELNLYPAKIKQLLENEVSRVNQNLYMTELEKIEDKNYLNEVSQQTDEVETFFLEVLELSNQLTATDLSEFWVGSIIRLFFVILVVLYICYRLKNVT